MQVVLDLIYLHLTTGGVFSGSFYMPEIIYCSAH